MDSDFSEEELEKIQQLRSSCSDILSSTTNKSHFLIRWLRARNLDVGKAEEMLRKSLKWREEENVDGILEKKQIPLKYLRLYPTGVLGRDKEDCVVLLVPLGRYNSRILIEEVGMEQALRYNVIWMETTMRFIKEAEEATGKEGLQYVEVVDVEHYSYRELIYGQGREFLLRTNKMFEENYPEVLKSVLIINTPKLFTLLFNIMKPFMAEATLRKIQIFGRGDETSWKKQIGEMCNLENVPERWGGTRKGSDIFCSQDPDVWIGAPIALSLFTNSEKSEVTGFKTERIKARDKFEIDLPVDFSDHPSSCSLQLTWKFKVDTHNIGFCILYKACSSNEDSSSDVIIFPECRVDAKEGVKEGSLPLTGHREGGVYTLTFDNRYSLTRSKTVHYSVQIEEV